ncbi:hypothetical protein ANN_12516 [Periplaneta americana]|uniref:Reverse transcriptase n=1 Tax=Periplaneta americana TaxID=6978 RepID=A0ABQ8TIS0_PERAM|nr:hypothetical protein ANN_12516 [Periplaneta americana]
MNPGSSTESYPAFAHIGLRENPGKNLNQVTCPDRESNPGHLVSRPDMLTVTPQAPQLQKWVTPKPGEKKTEWTNALKMSSNISAVRAIPGRTLSTTRCRHPDCSELETLGHVLGQCPKGELLINVRHHRVRHALAISWSLQDLENGVRVIFKFFCSRWLLCSAGGTRVTCICFAGLNEGRGGNGPVATGHIRQHICLTWSQAIKGNIEGGKLDPVLWIEFGVALVRRTKDPVSEMSGDDDDDDEGGRRGNPVPVE